MYFIDYFLRHISDHGCITKKFIFTKTGSQYFIIANSVIEEVFGIVSID